VSGVLGIFNENTVEVLAAKIDEAMENAAAFIVVILNWSKISNVKCCMKGNQLLDEICQQFRSVADKLQIQITISESVFSINLFHGNRCGVSSAVVTMQSE